MIVGPFIVLCFPVKLSSPRCDECKTTICQLCKVIGEHRDKGPMSSHHLTNLSKKHEGQRKEILLSKKHLEFAQGQLSKNIKTIDRRIERVGENVETLLRMVRDMQAEMELQVKRKREPSVTHEPHSQCCFRTATVPMFFTTADKTLFGSVVRLLYQHHVLSLSTALLVQRSQTLKQFSYSPINKLPPRSPVRARPRSMACYRRRGYWRPSRDG